MNRSLWHKLGGACTGGVCSSSLSFLTILVLAMFWVILRTASRKGLNGILKNYVVPILTCPTHPDAGMVAACCSYG